MKSAGNTSGPTVSALICYNLLMSYAVYSTRGWILGGSPSGEASKIYSIYTEDFGLVRAKAQSVRLVSSKLRYNLDDYSFATVSLVRGREVWRLTGAEKIEGEGGAAARGGRAPSSEALRLRARVLNLVRRLVQGEEKNDRLFAALLPLTGEAPAETSILSEALAALGYLDLASLEGKTDRERIQAINKALKETQL